jgi:hypothetical protein
VVYRPTIQKLELLGCPSKVLLHASEKLIFQNSILLLIFVINLHELVIPLSLVLWSLKGWIISILIHLVQEVQSLLLELLIFFQLVVLVRDHIEFGISLRRQEAVLLVHGAAAVWRVLLGVYRLVLSLLHETQLLLLDQMKVLLL